MAATSIQLGSFTDARTISAAHLTRLATAERALRNMPNATDDQIAAAITDDVFRYWKARVLEYERQLAAKAAVNAVTEIALT
jgi:hypothetical protein